MKGFSLEGEGFRCHGEAAIISSSQQPLENKANIATPPLSDCCMDPNIKASGRERERERESLALAKERERERERGFTVQGSCITATVLTSFSGFLFSFPCIASSWFQHGDSVGFQLNDEELRLGSLDKDLTIQGHYEVLGPLLFFRSRFGFRSGGSVRPSKLWAPGFRVLGSRVEEL